jgi:phosphopantothenoylcysteine decarboxylase/phosphopantothenate--cysteine ligase
VSVQKIKKESEKFVIELEKTKDILASLGEIKTKQFLIGFALETENEIENAKLKIQKKNLDLVVLNSLQDVGAGFGTPTNKVTFIDKNFKVEPMELKSKKAVANDIVNKVIAHFYD